MKTIYKIFGLLILISFLNGCSKWLDVNVNPDSPSANVITESVLLPGIVTTMSYELAGGFPARYTNAWVGQFALNGLAPDRQTFKMLDTDTDNTWVFTLYTNSLKNCNLMMQKAAANGNSQYLGIGQTLMAYALAVATDMWGSVPLSEAFQPITFPKPKYDSQEAVYTAILKYLDDAVANFNSTSAQTARPGSDDLLFQGDIAKWKKLAYSLKARYAIRLTYAKGGSAQADIALAALANGFESVADDADFAYFDKTGAENPWYQWMSKFNMLYLDTNIYHVMIKYNDPRLQVFAEPTYGGNQVGTIVPHRNGLLTTEAGVTSKLAIERTEYDDGEPVSPYFITKSTPVPFMTFAEVCFLKSEAYLWKGDYTNAYKFLKEGTIADMMKLQQNNAPAFTAAQADEFVASLPALPSTFEAAQEMIIELKFVANFLSVENYNDYRRTHYPVQVMPIGAQYPNVPVRLPYPTSAKLYNKDNVPVVVYSTDKVWWDKK
jgi:Starch-binding associating with outer membrane